jgi:hypothetical protein
VLDVIDAQSPIIADCAEPPTFTIRNRVSVFRYEAQTVEQALVQKAARTVSGLHAALLLLQTGYLQELRAIYRMQDEFADDIVFIGDIIESGNASDLHARFLADFWAEEYDVDGNPFRSSQKRDRVSRDKIQAAIARQPVFAVNPSDGQETHRTIAKTYAGYVHGASPHIMEMYGGVPEQFHSNWKPGTPPHEAAMREAISYFYRGLLMVIHEANLLQCPNAEDELRLIKDKFEEETGVGQGDPEKMIKKQKV